jgi:hypothetical protein
LPNLEKEMTIQVQEVFVFFFLRTHQKTRPEKKHSKTYYNLNTKYTEQGKNIENFKRKTPIKI